MIDARELRIGNYFMYDKKLVFIAEILKDNRVTVYDGFGFEKGEPLQMLQPIPITEEWLNKTNLLSDEYIFPDNGLFSIAKSLSINEINKYLVYYEDQSTGIYIEFMHELQNTYYEICRTELELKTK